MWLDRPHLPLNIARSQPVWDSQGDPPMSGRSWDPSPPLKHSFPERGASLFLIRLYSVSTGLVMNEILKCNHNWCYSCPRNVQPMLPAGCPRKQWCGWQAALLRWRLGSKLFPCASSWMQKRYLESWNKHAINSRLLAVCGSLCLLQTGMTG